MVSSLVHAQNYTVHIYAHEHGLQNELVKSITIDSLGFIWAATDYGLVHFNGNEFVDFEGKLSSDYVKSVISTHKGKIFVNTDLSFEEIRFKNKKESSIIIKKGGIQQSDSLLWYPKQFFEDTKNNLWFSDNSAVYKYHNGKLQRYYLGKANITGSYVHSFSFFENGFNDLILVSNTGNFYKYDYIKDAISPIACNFEINNITGVQKIADGHIIIGFNNMLGEMFFNADSKLVSFSALDSKLDASSFLLKSPGSVFIGTWTQGLWEAILVNGEVILKKINEINESGAINQIIGYQNEYLLATDYGIAILQDQSFISPLKSISNKFIQDVEYDTQNQNILVTDGQSIYRINEYTLDHEVIYSSTGNIILQVLPDDWSFWFSDNQGIIRQISNGRVIKTIDLSAYGSSIYNMIFDHAKNIWVCQDNLNGVIRISPQGNIKVFGERYGIFNQVNFIKTTPYPHLVMGTNNKNAFLLYYDSLNDTILNMSGNVEIDPDMPFSINDVYFDESKVLWLATNQGMYKRKGVIMERVDLEFQTQADIKAIAVDKSNNVWFASSNGVGKYDRKNIIPFTHLDGLPSKTISYRNLIVDSKNRIWAGTIAGVAYNGNIKEPSVTAKPTFISITEKGIPITDRSNNRFDNLTYLGFSFVSPQYPTNGITYQVKMSGKKNDWKLLVGRNEIYYSDLQVGEYQLMVKARQQGNSLWSEPLVYNFKIYTVWYQSWITWVVFAIVFFFAVFQMTKWRNRRLERERTKLNKLVSKRTIELEKTAKEIEATNKELTVAKNLAELSAKAKADFLSTMSHEIRTPLNGVLGMINILQLEKPREDQLDKINTMKFSAENLLTLISDILDFTKIDEGKLHLENIEFNLPELVRNVKAGFEHAATLKKIQLLVEISDTIPEYVFGDPGRLTQVLTNLMGNAIKFTEKGEVKLVVDSLDLKNKNAEISFATIDSGIGISHKQLEHIFDSFSQANSDTTRKYGGSGLGLAITKKLLDVMGSNIRVNSKPGSGSEFSFKLTFKTIERKKVEKKEKSIQREKPKSLKGLKILLVEDNLINTRIAKQILEKWEIDVDVAQDGQIAIDKFRPGKYDLILMDLHMPNVDGFEATRTIRQKDKKIPIVALTAAVKIQDKDTVLEAGMNEFVSKPFKPNELHKLISKLALGDFESEEQKGLRPDFESLKGYRVLLVEDNDINIKIATQFLEKWDLEYDVAKDGQIAIDMFEKDKYHLILMDLHLPNVDGYQATSAIREKDQNIPIVALTAAAMVQEKEKVLSSGMNDYVTKPFKPRDLYNKITRALLNATMNES